MFLDDFQDILEGCSIMSPDTIIMGDFNLHKKQDTTSFSKFCNLLDACNMVQHVKFPTHADGNILDLVITHSDCKSVGQFDCLPGLSDHFLLSFSLNFSVNVDQDY